MVVADEIQRDYRYVRLAPVGRCFHPEFNPDLSPKEMLALGVFAGKYLNDCRQEFPQSWFARAKLSSRGRRPSLNYFKVHASEPPALSDAKGNISPDDPRGWFQWYCRYYMGRRIPEEDVRQIGRWEAMARLADQVRRTCRCGDMLCMPRQRQALLQWAYDSRKL